MSQLTWEQRYLGFCDVQARFFAKMLAETICRLLPPEVLCDGLRGAHQEIRMRARPLHPAAAYIELLAYMGYIRSITMDNVTEFARHKQLTEALGTKIYFTQPYASREKGLIEYTNKLYRQIHI